METFCFKEYPSPHIADIFFKKAPSLLYRIASNAFIVLHNF